MKKLSVFALGAMVALGASAQEFYNGGVSYQVLSAEEHTCMVVGNDGSFGEFLDIPSAVEYESTSYTVTEIGPWSLNNGYFNVNIPNTVTVIREYAFYNNNGITDLRIPDSVISIGSEAFSACYNMSRVELGMNVQEIGEGAFRDTPLSIVVANGLTPATMWAGFNYTFPSTASVAVPAGCVSVYESAWPGATVIVNIPAESIALEQVDYYILPGGTVKLNVVVDPIDAPVFFSSTNSELQVDKDGNVTASADNDEYFGDIIVSTINGLQAVATVRVAGFEKFSDGPITYAVLNDSDVMLYSCDWNGVEGAFTVPSTVENNGVTYNVVSLRRDCFNGFENLTEVVIPASLREIGSSCFTGCRNLEKVTVADSALPLIVKGDNVFGWNNKMQEFYLGRNIEGTAPRYADELLKMTIGPSVTAIPQSFFEQSDRLAVINSLAALPPTLGDNALGWSTWEKMVVVSAESLDAYREAWGYRFYNIVSDVAATSVSIEPAETIIYTNQNQQLTLNIEPANAPVIWTSSDRELVRVDNSGIISYNNSNRFGEVTITATTLNGLTAECKVTAKGYIELAKPNITLEPGSIYKVAYEAAPGITADNLRWSIEYGDDAISVNDAGLIRAVNYGDACVRTSVIGEEGWEVASYNTYVSVRAYPESISLERTEYNMYVGNTEEINVIYTPDSDEVARSIEWTSADPEIAYVYEENWGDGRPHYFVRTQKAGDTTITGTAPNGLTVELNVHAYIDVESVEFNANKVIVAPGETFALTFTTNPEFTNREFEWMSFDSNIATVDENGVVTGVASGETEISLYLKDGWQRWTVPVMVGVLPESVELLKNEITFNSFDNSERLELIFNPDSADVIRDITWTVADESVAVIISSIDSYWDENTGQEKYMRVYYVEPRNLGSTEFTGVTPNGLTVSGVVNVNGIRVNNQNIRLTPGQSERIDFTASSEAIAERVYFINGDANVIQVSLDGIVTAVGYGNTYVQISSDPDGEYYTGYAYVEVRPEHGFVLSESEMRVYENDWFSLQRYYAFGEGSWGSWSVSDNSVIEIMDNWSDSCNLRAVAPGVATVTFTAENGETATCEITVMGYAQNITLSKNEASLTLGETMQLEATITPDNTGQTVEWTSYDENVVTVDADGNVTAVGYGSTVVRAWVRDAEAYCNITVGEMPESISVVETSVGIKTGRFVTIYEDEFVKLAPESEWLNRSLTWSVDDESVTYLEKDGTVIYLYGLSDGVATVTVTTANGLSAEFKVFVNENGSTGVDTILAAGATADIYTVNGVLVKSNATYEDFKQLGHGIYLVRMEGKTVKVVR